MTRAEAALILSIRYAKSHHKSTKSRNFLIPLFAKRQSAPKEKIRTAHRRIMLANHPDNGGSDYMASKINEAKDVLIKDLD
jgi:DnaJ family protein C protein 19